MNEGARAAQTIHLARAVIGTAPGWRTGDALTATNEDGELEVLVDGPEGSSAEEDDFSGDANQPIIASCWGASVAAGERVNLVTLPDGTTWVVGSTLGQPDCLAVARIVGGTADQTFANTSENTIVGLEVEALVLHPGHVVEIDVNARIQSSGAANAITGRVRRVDEAGTVVEVGRWMGVNQFAVSQTTTAGPTVIDYSPEPGLYIYRATIQATVTGVVVVTNPAASTPETGAFIRVRDGGALPDGAIT